MPKTQKKKVEVYSSKSHQTTETDLQKCHSSEKFPGDDIQP